MGKDLKGRELGKGLYQRKDGRYEARTLSPWKDMSPHSRSRLHPRMTGRDCETWSMGSAAW